jgi:acetyl/propionyl-CoA carboxylase alpha subunit
MRRLLIANRGEIAVRIARSARERDLSTIAVYSEADRGAVHVRACDESVEIGPAPAAQSYLSAEAILRAARLARADAIHPGYGFLSENPDFAEAVEKAGLIWIGPPAPALRQLGDKLAARSLMADAGVPVVPGFDACDASEEAFVSGAERLGYPVLVKAAAGGGGKGMRRVERPDDLPAALEAGRREALAAFGDARVYLEKALDRPRHVEFQIFGDAQGQVLSLFERECSIQRRFQKVVEESPSPALDPRTRSQMAEAAVAAGKAAGYRSAGTVEFLLDKEGRFFFLEINPRLQVEHPVTEEVLRIDLVAMQLAVAEGSPLPPAWGKLSPRGQAIECRLYAEDPETGLPRSGNVLEYEEPRGPGIRVDSGIAKGSRVGIDYDPILAKVIAFGENRPAAIAKLRRGLSEFIVLGVTTNLRLLRRVIESAEFSEGRTDTGLLDRLDDPEREVPEAVLAAAALVWARARERAGRGGAGRPDPWEDASGWRSA